MLNKLIIFLIRRKLGLKKFERFQFENQKSKIDFYYFNDVGLIKMKPYKGYEGSWYEVEQSGVSLNWLLNPECKIRKWGRMIK